MSHVSLNGTGLRHPGLADECGECRERIRPVHKPAKRRQCILVRGIGWVLNPTRRPMNLGQED